MKDKKVRTHFYMAFVAFTDSVLTLFLLYRTPSTALAAVEISGTVHLVAAGKPTNQTPLPSNSGLPSRSK